MNERELHRPEDAAQYWNDERELGAVYFGRDTRLVTVRSHIAEERFFGRGSETLFTLAELEGIRSYVQSRFSTRPPVGRAIVLGVAQAWH